VNTAIIGSRGYPYVYSGYETFTRELSLRLVRQGVCVTVFCQRNLFPERVRANYSWEKITAQHCGLFASLAGGKRC
jgi:hypothetical protein